VAASECKNCGAVVDDSWSVCPACGGPPSMGVSTDLEDRGTAATSEVTSRPMSSGGTSEGEPARPGKGAKTRRQGQRPARRIRPRSKSNESTPICPACGQGKMDNRDMELRCPYCGYRKTLHAAGTGGPAGPEAANGFVVRPDTTVDELLTEYPFLLDSLRTYGWLARQLDDPDARPRFGQMNLDSVASYCRVPVKELKTTLSDEIENRTGGRPAIVDLESDLDTGPWYWKALAAVCGLVVALFGSIAVADGLAARLTDEGYSLVLFAAFIVLFVAVTWLAALVLHRVFGRRIDENGLLNIAQGCFGCLGGCTVMLLAVAVLMALVVATLAT
jgi:predicted  nucleic acid-binding Zn-ribbon protein